MIVVSEPIAQNSPMPENTRIRIVVDHRERNSAAYNLLSRDPEVELEVAVLDIGDYEIYPGCRLEAKRAADFTASILDRRLFTQIEAARDSGVELLFLVEGDPYSVERLHTNAITGALSYIAVIERLPILSCSNSAQAASLIKTAARHRSEGLGYTINLKPPRPKTIPQQQLYLVAGLPGIGPAKATALMAHFRTPASLFRASETEIATLPGFGAKSAKAIVEILNTPAA